MKKLIILFLFLVGLSESQAQFYTTKNGAVDGYDVVAYFKASKATKGNENFKYTWGGVTWYFSSAQNLDVFKASPDLYIPQYGGYCAYGTSEGHKAPTKANAWTIVDGKLYLNYNTEVMTEWRKNQAELIKKADTQWPKIKDSEM